MTHAEVMDGIDVSVTIRHGMPHWPDNPVGGYHPVKPHGSDGASARAILRPIGPGQPASAEAAP